MFLVSNTILFAYLSKHQDITVIVKSILRTYGGISEHPTKINTLRIAEKSSVDEDTLITALERLETDLVISLNRTKTDAQITFIEPREDDKTINRIAAIIEQQNTLKHEQVQSVLNYVNNDGICKNIQLLSYFGEENVTPCGNCSVCIKAEKNISKNEIIALKKRIIEALEHGDLSSRMLAETLACSEKNIKNVLPLLLEHGIITITKKNTYKLHHL